VRRFVLSIAALTLLVLPAGASGRADWWFATPGGAAYCGFDAKGWTCIRPQDGFWIRLVFGRRENIVDVRKGVSEAYRSNRERAVRTLRYGEEFVTSDAAIVTCWSRSSGVTCKHYLGLSFTIGRGGGYRIFHDAPGLPPNVTPLFKTGHGIYCGINRETFVPEQPSLDCWNPTDGLEIGIGYSSRRGSHNRNEEAIGFRPRGFRMLAYGEMLEWRCRHVTATTAERCSTSAAEPVFTCTSTRARLTCRNRGGHGFWASARSFYTF
jgi:hypothetical protein